MSAARSASCLRLASAARAGARPAIAAAARTSPACLFAAPPSSASPASRVALLHTSASLAGKRRSRFKSIHLDDMGLSSPEKVQEFTEKMYPKYTDAELKTLSERYTPEQMEAIKAGEAAIDPQDLTVQARFRTDPYVLPYLDDFSKIMPIIDKKVRTAPLPDPNAKFHNEAEFTEDLLKWADDLIPEEHRHLLQGSQNADEALKPQFDALEASGKSRGEIEAEKQQLLRTFRTEQKERFKPLEAALSNAMFNQFPKLLHERSGMTDNNRPAHSPVAPSLGKNLPTNTVTDMRDPDDEVTDPEGIWRHAQRVTGKPLTELRRIPVKVVVERWVANQTRLGKIRTVWSMAVAGTKDGRLGIGVAKSVDPSTAHIKSKLKAVMNMRPIKKYEDRTIYGNVSAKVGATIVEIRARPPGFGIRASHRLFEIFRMMGIRDISARMPRGRNPMNSVYACVKALNSQKDPGQIAVGRGKKMVDVRNVYFGGNVH